MTNGTTCAATNNVYNNNKDNKEGFNCYPDRRLEETREISEGSTMQMQGRISIAQQTSNQKTFSSFAFLITRNWKQQQDKEEERTMEKKNVQMQN